MISIKKWLKIFSFEYSKIFTSFLGGIKKILWSLAKDAFLSTLILVFLSILLGELTFYKYGFLLEVEPLHEVPEITKFEENTYNSVVSEWEKREDVFNNLLELGTNVKNPFYSN